MRVQHCSASRDKRKRMNTAGQDVGNPLLAVRAHQSTLIHLDIERQTEENVFPQRGARQQLHALSAVGHLAIHLERPLLFGHVPAVLTRVQRSTSAS